MLGTVVYLQNDQGQLVGQGGRRGQEEIAYPLVVNDWDELQGLLSHPEVARIALQHTHSEHVLNLPTSTAGFAVALHAHGAPLGIVLGFEPKADDPTESLAALTSAGARNHGLRHWLRRREPPSRRWNRKMLTEKRPRRTSRRPAE